MGAIGRDFDGLPPANVYLVFRLRCNDESRRTEHRFNTGAVRNPPVCFIMRVAVLNEVHLGIARNVEVHLGMEIVVGIHVRYFAAAPLHALKEEQVACDVFVDQIERE